MPIEKIIIDYQLTHFIYSEFGSVNLTLLNYNESIESYEKNGNKNLLESVANSLIALILKVYEQIIASHVSIILNKLIIVFVYFSLRNIEKNGHLKKKNHL